jgi:hypothetical protein
MKKYGTFKNSTDNLFQLTNSVGTVEIYSNTDYLWCKQIGRFIQEDDDIFVWQPAGGGSPSYFNTTAIQHIANNQTFPKPI